MHLAVQHTPLTNSLRWDSISINDKTIDQKTFRKVENHFLQLNQSRQIGASPFEILTATAFTIFNDENVRIGVVEVGMGGTLDTTNILNNQAVSVISKIARDHEGFLGNTLSEIASHKAGILRPDVPYIINPSNEKNVQITIQDYAKQIGAGPRLYPDSLSLAKKLYDSSKWERLTRTMAPFQQDNVKLAMVAVMQTMQSMNQDPKPLDFVKTLLANLKVHHPGRQEMIKVPPVFRHPSETKNHILVDGAHNPDAAKALDEFVRDNMRYGRTPSKDRPVSGWPVTWVLAMTEGKDARQYLSTLLKPGDNVVTTTFGPVDGMPWVKPMDPKELLEVARSVEPGITGVHVPIAGPLRALCTAKYLSNQLAPWSPIVLTGSLYLVGDFHRELRPRASKTWWKDNDEVTAADREEILKMQAEERIRANTVLKSNKDSDVGADEIEASQLDEQMKLEAEIEALTREVQGLEVEEKRLADSHSIVHDEPVNSTALPQDEQGLSAAERLEREDLHFAKLHSTPEQVTEHIARAEKAERDRALQVAALEKEAEARQQKHEKRAELEKRREARKKRSAEERQREKERKEYGREMMSTTQPPAESEARPRKPGHRDASRVHQKAMRSSQGYSTEEPQDALSGLFSTTRAPLTKSNQTRSPPPQPANPRSSNQRKPPAPASAQGNLRIHMHYANVSGPNRSKLKEFPETRRTRAWANNRRSGNPGYKTPAEPSVVNYYEHEWGQGSRRRRE
jgi:folylpolyglutamate synthase